MIHRTQAECSKTGAMKGQTTMVLLVLVVIIFAGSVIMLMGFMESVKQTDYLNLYTHNLLLSVMRSDTGYTDQNCKMVSDALSCAFFTPELTCGNNGPSCLELANRTVNEYIQMFSMVKKSYSYLFVVEPQGFRAGTESEPFRIVIGDASLANTKKTKYTANEQIRKALSSGVYNLNARLIIMEKP